MTNSILHTASSRGEANHGWLQSRHSFSFASYYDPERMNFGVLRVLNDDRVAPGMGFGTHPHDNMEIISIPLEGDLQHKDSMGTVATIRHGDIQAMSAGTGVRHSEYNASKENPVKFLQIWILPNATNVKPRYDQITLDLKDRHNQLQQILSPHAGGPGVWIHQQAWFHLGNFDKDFQVEYELKRQGNGVYAFVLNGDFKIGDQLLHHRDGYGIWDIEKLDITALSSSSEILLMEVPMEV